MKCDKTECEMPMVAMVEFTKVMVKAADGVDRETTGVLPTFIYIYIYFVTTRSMSQTSLTF